MQGSDYFRKKTKRDLLFDLPFTFGLLMSVIGITVLLVYGLFQWPHETNPYASQDQTTYSGSYGNSPY